MTSLFFLVLTGAFLANKHRLLQFHFHWGAEDGRGSEHTLNGNEFSAEVFEHSLTLKIVYLANYYFDIPAICIVVTLPLIDRHVCLLCP